MPFLRSAGLFTQQNSLTSPWVVVSHKSSLLPSPGITQLPNFSGTIPDGDHSPSKGTLLSVCLPLHLFLPSNFKQPDLYWWSSVASLLCSGRGGSCQITIADPLAVVQSTCDSCALVPGAQDLPIGLQNLLTVCF